MQKKFEIGSRVYSSQFGAGEVIASEGAGDHERVTVRFERVGTRELLAGAVGLELMEGGELPSVPPAAGRAATAQATAVPDDQALRRALREVLRDELGLAEVKLLDRWRGGTMILKPGREGQKEKQVPLDDLFHKIVMVRDRLRVLEQKLNAHAGLSDADKVELQQYITRVYGSLTTFNVLFADKDDWFVGQKGE